MVEQLLLAEELELEVLPQEAEGLGAVLQEAEEPEGPPQEAEEVEVEEVEVEPVYSCT